MSDNFSQDLLGKAISDYFERGKDVPVRLWINDSEDEPLYPSHFFRSKTQMDDIEQHALRMCKCQVLDVGAGAGCHALLLQESGLEVTALDNSPLSCEVMKNRGLSDVCCADVMQFDDKKFDTILLLMNGFGIAGTEARLPFFLQHLKSLLKPGGCIMGESTDVLYMYQHGEHAALDLSKGYYGEVSFKLRSRTAEVRFPWLFPDEYMLEELASSLNLGFAIEMRGKRHNFLCKMTLSA